MAPSQGLVFPDDALVLPLVYEPGSVGGDRTTLLAWEGDQHLRRGFLSARTATQYVVARATPTAARLEVKEAASAGQAPEIENRLGVRIHHLMLRDKAGALFAGQDVAAGGRATLGAVELEAAHEAMRPWVAAAEPRAPHDYDPTQLNDNLFTLMGVNRSRMMANFSSDVSAGDPLMSESVLERNLEAMVSSVAAGPARSSYIAIVEHSPLVITGLGKAREEASLHVIRGWYE
jgi:hypothetical protein